MGSSLKINDSLGYTQISNCIFDNTESKKGGGIYLYNIKDIYLSNNHFQKIKAEAGSAIIVRYFKNAKVNNSTFNNIEATQSAGAVILIFYVFSFTY